MNRRLLAKASFVAIAAAIAAPAAAQDAVDVLRDEILVTGTKKANAENVQDVPLAVTAYGEDQLDALKVRDLQDLSYSVPNVQFEDVGTTPGYANFSIRGLGINSSIPSIDPAVGVFVDGVFLGSPAGVVLDVFDLESIEVLRGPQGILFGRNVTGGAVLLNSKRPDLSEASADLKLAAESGLRGTKGNYFASGGFTVPLIEDVLAVRLAGYYNNDQGYFDRYLGGPNLVSRVNAIGGAAAALQNGIPVMALGNPAGVPFPIAVNQPDDFQSFGQSETWTIRPSIRFAPTDGVDLFVRYEHFESSGDGPAGQNHPGFIQPPFAGGVTPSPVPLANAFFSAPKDSFTFSIDEPGFYETTVDAITAELNIDVGFGDGRITNVFGWRDAGGTTRSDIDATPFWLFHSGSDTSTEQISNEIRYSGRFFDRVDFTAGFYYYEDEKLYREDRALLGGFRNLTGGGTQDSRNYGIFGEFEYDLTERLSFIFGGRWTNERKEVQLYNITVNPPTCDPFTGTGCVTQISQLPSSLQAVVSNPDVIIFNETETWKNFTPKIGFTFAATDEFNLYGHWTQGVRSGGYNFRNTSIIFPIDGYDEETVDSFEVGFKAQPADGRAVINAAFFYQEITDMQREINLPDAVAGVVQLIRNTADAHIFGIEIEGRYFVTDNLVLTGNIGRLDGDYDSVLFDLNSDGVTNATDLTLQIPRLAPWTYGAGFLHTWGPLTTRFNWSHRDDNAYTDNNLGILFGADVIDAAFALNIHDRATLSLYGQNLLNEVTHGGETQLPTSIGGGSFAPLNKGRIVGVELQIGF